MKRLILRGIRHSFNLFSAWLEKRDEDTVGWDDAIAHCLDCVAGIIEEAENGNGISRKSVVLSLEIAQTLIENLDNNNVGFDDAFARKIGEIKTAIDLENQKQSQ